MATGTTRTQIRFTFILTVQQSRSRERRTLKISTAASIQEPMPRSRTFRWRGWGMKRQQPNWRCDGLKANRPRNINPLATFSTQIWVLPMEANWHRLCHTAKSSARSLAEALVNWPTNFKRDNAATAGGSCSQCRCTASSVYCLLFAELVSLFFVAKQNCSRRQKKCNKKSIDKQHYLSPRNPDRAKCCRRVPCQQFERQLWCEQ